MRISFLFSLGLFIFPIAIAVAAPPPPPPPGRVELISNFFQAAPTVLPSKSLDDWSRYISPDVQVFYGDKRAFSNRADWLADLNAPKGLGDERISVSLGYLQFYELSDEGIKVLEWALPYKKGAVFHGVEPYRFTTYYFDRKQLVRVVYDQSMAPYDLKSGKRWN
jgi:hypothetical protein